ncbi:SubName: Full=Uncharacterized protein {ECO:0000313/EMBL:CCA70278.1} [Serendipita indica DSM 11827]|nr:SubName: Full=Uncharacterized protein {ECO:0000313/EMBL:CCA70278.1} [Serendipita indica DSM 11827]
MTFPTPDAVPLEEDSRMSRRMKANMENDWGSTVVTEQTAGRFLAALREASPGNIYWPRNMMTEEDYQQTVSYFDLVPLLQTVHQRNAYAWLAIEVLTPTWQDYLFPDLSNVLSITRPPEVRVGSDQSKHTAPFRPTLYKPDSLPASAELCNDLPMAIRVELEQIVGQSARQQAKISSSAAESVHSVLQQDDLFVKESDLSVTIGYIRRAIGALSRALFEDAVPLTFSTEQRTDDGNVRTDGVFWHRTGEPLILWETKSPSAGEKHMNTMVSSQSITFSRDQMQWENEHAILAKLAWHAMDADMKPPWAVIFAGRVYMIVHISYRVDNNNHLRPILRYSPMIPVYDSKLPIWSALLYMVRPDQSNGARSLEDILKVPANGDLPCHGPSKSRRSGPTSTSIEASDGLSVRTEDSFTIYMSRASDLSSTVSEPMLPFELLLTGKPRQGGSGQVYRSTSSYVLKLAYRTQTSKNMLFEEFNWYRLLASAGVQGISHCHGLFRSADNLALVLDYEGEELLDFDKLNSDQKKHLYRF